MHDIISDIGNFIFIEDHPQKCDLIIAVGGSFPQIPEKAAALYRQGYAPCVLAGGRFSVTTGVFKGVSDKADRYDGDYFTECEFYTDVLTKNGVPEHAVIKEDRSGHTRENAEFAREITEKLGLSVRSAIIVCKRFHARRCLMFFSSAFPETEFCVVPADVHVGEYDLTRENWFLTDHGIRRVLGELARCGSQMTVEDIKRYASLPLFVQSYENE